MSEAINHLGLRQKETTIVQDFSFPAEHAGNQGNRCIRVNKLLTKYVEW